MTKLLFVSGRDKNLALREITSLLKRNEKEFEITFSNNQVILVKLKDSSSDKQVEEWIELLGGITKIARVLDIVKENELEEKLDDIVSFEVVGRKINFSVNDCNEKPEKELFLKIVEGLKKEFKKQKIRAVIKQPRKSEHGRLQQTSPSQIITLKLITEGLDLLFFVKDKTIILGKTIATYNPFKVMEIEKKMPKHDYLIESSSRLNKILINLAMVKAEQTILDPFCGTGGLLIEGLKRKHNAIGVELKSKTLDIAKTNLNWAKKEFNLKNNFQLIKGNARELSKIMNKKKFDAIITEPFLGGFLRQLPTKNMAMAKIQELEKLYSSFFNETGKLMREKQRIVIVLPELLSFDGAKFKLNEKVFLEHGFKKTIEPILYGEKDKKINRLIYVLEKN
ncbi:MAG: methyltransferase domain-containing protein [archaeon]